MLFRAYGALRDVSLASGLGVALDSAPRPSRVRFLLLGFNALARSSL